MQGMRYIQFCGGGRPSGERCIADRYCTNHVSADASVKIVHPEMMELIREVDISALKLSIMAACVAPVCLNKISIAPSTYPNYSDGKHCPYPAITQDVIRMGSSLV